MPVLGVHRRHSRKAHGSGATPVPKLGCAHLTPTGESETVLLGPLAPGVHNLATPGGSRAGWGLCFGSLSLRVAGGVLGSW